MKNLMISKKWRQKKAEDFSGVKVRGQEVFMEGSNEEFDDLEEIKVEKGKLFQLRLFAQKGLVIIASGYRLSSSQFCPT